MDAAAAVHRAAAGRRVRGAFLVGSRRPWGVRVVFGAHVVDRLGVEIFFDVRKVPGLKKKPSTSELIDWLKLLMADDIPEEILRNRDTSKAIPPLYGALVKNEQDVQLLERLAFMNRRQSGGSSPQRG